MNLSEKLKIRGLYAWRASNMGDIILYTLEGNKRKAVITRSEQTKYKNAEQMWHLIESKL